MLQQEPSGRLSSSSMGTLVVDSAKRWEWTLILVQAKRTPEEDAMYTHLTKHLLQQQGMQAYKIMERSRNKLLKP